MLVSCGDDKTLKLWNIAEKKFLTTIQAHKNWVRTCAFSPDSRTVISGSDDTSIKFWDAETGTELAKITDHTGMINKV